MFQIVIFKNIQIKIFYTVSSNKLPVISNANYSVNFRNYGEHVLLDFVFFVANNQIFQEIEHIRSDGHDKKGSCRNKEYNYERINFENKYLLYYH